MQCTDGQIGVTPTLLYLIAGGQGNILLGTFGYESDVTGGYRLMLELPGVTQGH